MPVADEAPDIFGKIDAILGKRAGFAGGQPEKEEFPVLTEVVEAALAEPLPPAKAADAMAGHRPVPAEEAGRDDDEAVAPSAGPSAGLGDMELDRLAAALEARLSDLFIRQQLRLEALVRRVVREELERRHEGLGEGRERGPTGL